MTSSSSYPEAPSVHVGRLAVDGGKSVRTRPFAPWPSHSSEEVEAVRRVLESGNVNYWTGQEGRQFEAEFAAFTGCKHAIAVASGTVALELALQALGIGQGDEVIVPSRTFIASASCVVMRGATPVMADIDRESQTITAQTIERVLSARTRAIIAVHLAGWPCDMEPILELARKRGLLIIEDCAQAHGASYKGLPVGSMGDANAFSFCQDKIITTGGEGGMLTTHDRGLWSRAWAFKDHGKSHDAVYNRPPLQRYRWLHESFGTNWRLTEMQSAIGRLQLARLRESVAARRSLAGILTMRFSQISALRLTIPPAEVHHSYYKYYVFLRPERLREGWGQERIIDAINAEGVPCFVGSCSEIYLEPAFPKEMRPLDRLPVARELGETSLMFLVHPTLTESDMLDTAEAVEKVLSEACN
ncbi:MAG: DegT/DnrJ/EryC1/StrS aminotransferase family protein [Acidobacteriaceae bacterium]|nr:DegT/DnrJ/EryC1/StrS aminotransferase family protein [Acidobacteriaceae bacterium]